MNCIEPNMNPRSHISFSFKLQRSIKKGGVVLHRGEIKKWFAEKGVRITVPADYRYSCIKLHAIGHVTNKSPITWPGRRLWKLAVKLIIQHGCQSVCNLATTNCLHSCLHSFQLLVASSWLQYNIDARLQNSWNSIEFRTWRMFYNCVREKQR